MKGIKKPPPLGQSRACAGGFWECSHRRGRWSRSAGARCGRPRGEVARPWFLAAATQTERMNNRKPWNRAAVCLCVSVCVCVCLSVCEVLRTGERRRRQALPTRVGCPTTARKKERKKAPACDKYSPPQKKNPQKKAKGEFSPFILFQEMESFLAKRTVSGYGSDVTGNRWLALNGYGTPRHCRVLAFFCRAFFPRAPLLLLLHLGR
jgi:hypothetical protein